MLLIHLLLCASMIVISYSSLPDKSLSGSKRSLLNNKKRWWDDKDEQDLIDLMRFKETNSSSSSSYTGRHDKWYEIESSLLEIEEYQQKNRQFIYGTCTCSSTSFTCSPTPDRTPGFLMGQKTSTSGHKNRPFKRRLLSVFLCVDFPLYFNAVSNASFIEVH